MRLAKRSSVALAAILFLPGFTTTCGAAQNDAKYEATCRSGNTAKYCLTFVFDDNMRAGMWCQVYSGLYPGPMFTCRPIATDSGEVTWSCDQDAPFIHGVYSLSDDAFNDLTTRCSTVCQQKCENGWK